MANSQHAPAPLGGRFVTPTTAVLGLLVAIAAFFLAKRFIFGLGSVANINDGYPWGIWVVIDVVIGSALACGGFAVALLVYVFNKGEYHPLVRPALLASLFGYTLAGAAVIFDLGRYWNFWQIFWPGYVNPKSVMFEVAVCVSAYILVMWIESAPAILERFGLHELRRKLNGILFFIIALGVLLPAMHQSSLGSLLIAFGYQIDPLWQTVLLPLLYLISAVTMGFAVVIFEAALCSSGFRRPMEMQILSRLANVMKTTLLVFLAIRFAQLAFTGAIVAAFKPSWIAFWFWIETALFVIPAVLLLKPEARRSPQRLFVASMAMILAGSLYRLNSYLTGYDTGAGWRYFPSLPELMVTIGLIAFEILAYIAIVRLLPVLPREGAGPAPATVK